MFLRAGCFRFHFKYTRRQTRVCWVGFESCQLPTQFFFVPGLSLARSSITEVKHQVIERIPPISLHQIVETVEITITIYLVNRYVFHRILINTCMVMRRLGASLRHVRHMRDIDSSVELFSQRERVGYSKHIQQPMADKLVMRRSTAYWKLSYQSTLDVVTSASGCKAYEPSLAFHHTVYSVFFKAEQTFSVVSPLEITGLFAK